MAGVVAGVVVVEEAGVEEAEAGEEEAEAGEEVVESRSTVGQQPAHRPVPD